MPSEHTGDRSIRNIPVSGARRTMHEPHEHAPRPRRSRRLWWFIAGVLLVCGILGLLLSTVFEGATITAYPRTASVTPPATLTAFLKPAAGALAYQTVSFSTSATTTVAAAGSAHVSRTATGIVTIYNTFSTATQRLIANTRFEAPDGKIYRIHDSIVVPGAKNVGGSLTAGTATVSIFADSPGDSYNRSGTTDFTIPGFKGTPQYGKFSARSSGPLTGGFVGDEPAVNPADLAKAQSDLKNALDSGASAGLAKAIPSGFIAIAGSTQTNYDNVVKVPNEGGTATLSQRATSVLSIVRSSDLAAALAKSITGYKGEAVDILDPSKISVSVMPPTAKTKPAPGVLTLALAGSPTVVWQFDKAALVQALAGKNKADFQNIVQGFLPAITRADAKIRPFWIVNFPSDSAKISVTIAVEK